MNTAPSLGTPTVVPAPRATGDWLTLTVRMTRWDLLQMWRRVMAKVLLGVLLGIFLLVIGGLLLGFAAAGGSGASTSAAEISSVLTFPRSTALAVEYTAFMGVVLICIIAGALVGGEYAFGTQRLALSRGIGRGQALLAQVAALVIVAAAAVTGMMVLGALIGVTLGPALGGSPDGLSGAGVAQLLAYWAATSLRLVTYTLIAVLFATLSRSTAGGVGGALGFIVIELIALPILLAIITSQRAYALLVTHTQPPSYVDTLTFIRAVFVQTNADALVAAAREGPLNLQLSPPIARQLASVLPAPPSAAQALVVLLLWCAALGGLSYWVIRQRDVTE
jgi:ABC-type transport system involved in multi-copper enzyme maturation permease subunit